MHIYTKNHYKEPNPIKDLAAPLIITSVGIMGGFFAGYNSRPDNSVNNVGKAALYQTLKLDHNNLPAFNGKVILPGNKEANDPVIVFASPDKDFMVTWNSPLNSSESLNDIVNLATLTTSNLIPQDQTIYLHFDKTGSLVNADGQQAAVTTNIR